tara:strand:+ start:2499 stop:2933 length:435 start_codon:yes stop_codon:yes gene_type:complete
MTAKEIRIGNWVTHNKKPQQLVGIKFHNLHRYEIPSRELSKYVRVETTLSWEYLGVSKDIAIGEINPIKLTQKWLTAFGFKQRGELGDYFHPKGDRYTIGNNKFFDMWVVDTVITHRIKYVHELQNIYFELDKLELEPIKKTEI